MQLDVIGIAAALLAAAASFNTYAQPSTAPQASLGPMGSTVYVFASRANLRALPQATAAVLAQPVANTGLKLLAQTGEWCEVEAAATDAPPRRGFITCNLLRASPLTLAGVRAELDAARRAGKGVLDWESRGFWVAPSLLRWSQVGQALEATHLTPEITKREISGGKALRFKVPEFEAMKQRLAAGVLVTAEALEPVPAEPGPPQAAAAAASQPDAGLVVQALVRVRIPRIEPLLFQADQVPVLDTAIRYKEAKSHRAMLLADALSARNAAPLQAIVTRPAAYALGPGAALLARSNQPRFIRTAGPLDVIIGVWDAGALQITFGKDAFLHGVTAQGQPTRERVLGLELDFGVDYGCGGTARVELRNAAVPGFAKASSALIKWAGMAMPGGSTARAQVKSRKFGGAKPADLVVTHEIDLNNDGIADFFVMQGRYVPQISGDGLWSTVFGNIGGEWRLLSYDQEEDCT